MSGLVSKLSEYVIVVPFSFRYAKNRLVLTMQCRSGKYVKVFRFWAIMLWKKESLKIRIDGMQEGDLIMVSLEVFACPLGQSACAPDPNTFTRVAKGGNECNVFRQAELI